MPRSVAVTAAANEIIGRYRSEAKIAAGSNDTISKTEQKQLSAWGQSTLEKLREESGGRITVDAFVDAIAPKVQRALRTVAGNERLTKSEANKLFVPELKAHALRLLGVNGLPAGDGLSALKASVRAAGDVEGFSDYNRGFSVTSYPAGTSEAKILAEAYNVSESDIEDMPDLFHKTSGRAGVQSFVSMIIADAEADEENADGSDPDDDFTKEHLAMANAGRAIAAAVPLAFEPVSQFTSVTHHSHGIAEDGDLQTEVLIAKKTDGSFLTMAYTNFPF
jgi:hypothetical protein